jgi:hypothetical protein
VGGRVGRWVYSIQCSNVLEIWVERSGQKEVMILAGRRQVAETMSDSVRESARMAKAQEKQMIQIEHRVSGIDKEMEMMPETRFLAQRTRAGPLFSMPVVCIVYVCECMYVCKCTCGCERAWPEVVLECKRWY